MYHVPQHWRREKLRFAPHDPPTTFTLPQNETSPLLFSDLANSQLRSSSNSCFLENPSYRLSPSTQFVGSHSLPLLPPAHHTHGDHLTRHHDFSLSLSSSSGHQCEGGVAFGPFTGYAAVLSESRYLEPARQLLEEMCSVVRGGAMPLPTDPTADASAAKLKSCGEIMDVGVSGTEQKCRKSWLISLLDEVCRGYMQYYQQIQAIISAFGSVAGLRVAAPYVAMAVETLEKHFRCLRNAISDQLHKTSKALIRKGFCEKDVPGSGFTRHGVNNQRAANNSGDFRQQHVWRSQRGLPERAVAVLRTWLFDHFLHPYPTDVDKQILAKQTGLSRNQVSNWFINARVRLWKPMVEEIHSLETRQLQTTEANHSIQKRGQISSACTTINPSNKDFWVDRRPTSKPYQDDTSKGLPENGILEAGTDMIVTGDVSLSLGLHQNTGFSLTDPNAACHLGLEECSGAYVIGALEGEDRHYGRAIGGHFVHDFVE